jgi:hypothetical protein
MIVAESFVDIATDPAHIIAELIFTFTIDFLIIALLWGVVFKKLLLPALTKKVHEEIDIEHGYSHDSEGENSEPKIGNPVDSAFSNFVSNRNEELLRKSGPFGGDFS